jgi:anti-sigma B factor antagonist
MRWSSSALPAGSTQTRQRVLGDSTERSDHAGDLLDGSGPPPGPVTIEIVSATAAVVTLGGDHDVASLDAIEDAFRVAGAGRNLLVDLSDCTFIDSTIIKLLLRTLRVLEATGARFELVIDPTPSGHVSRVAALMGIPEVIPTHDTRRDGIHSLSAVSGL